MAPVGAEPDAPPADAIGGTVALTGEPAEPLGAVCLLPAATLPAVGVPRTALPPVPPPPPLPLPLPLPKDGLVVAPVGVELTAVELLGSWSRPHAAAMGGTKSVTMQSAARLVRIVESIGVSF